jgi:phosphoesterase RecJ-like protein
MPIPETLLTQAHAVLAAAHHILVVSHQRPDGDAIGSTLALGLALQAAGKQVEMVNVDGVPLSFRHLQGAGEIKRSIHGAVDCIVTVDSSDLHRTGEVLNGFGPPDLNIDHHATNTNFAKINLVDVEAVAVTQMLAEFLPRWGYPITPPIGAALVTGLLTDTIGFRTRNVTPQALRVTADLMEVGVDMPGLYERSLILRSFEALRFWGTGLENLQRNDRMVWATLSMEDRRRVGYSGRDDADLINILSTVQDCDLAVIFVEQSDNKVKVSWRARSDFDVSQVALAFGGGGHPAASGAEISGTLEEVQESVLSSMTKFLT